MNNDSQTPWTVRLGKLGNDEWAADVVFSDVSDATWGSIKELAGKYARFNFRACPPVSASDNDRRLRFRLGHAMEKPRPVDGLSSVECETLRNNLVGCCEGLYKNGLGLWHLDRQLIWKIDGFFTFVPVFWLPAIPDATTVVPTMAPECSEGVLTEPSQKTDIYAIAAFCYQMLTGQEHDPTQSVLPGDVNPQLQTWDAILDPALRSNPARRPDSFQDWLQCRPNQITVLGRASSAPVPVPPQKTAIVPPVENGETAPTAKVRRSYRRWIIAAVLLFAVLYLARTYMPDLMRKIPVVNLAAPSYQRGTGSYVVRYADRSYDRATWKMVWSTENVDERSKLRRIGGWDKNNIAISPGNYTKYLVFLKEGHWAVQETEHHEGNKPYFLSKDVFVVSLTWKTSVASIYTACGFNQSAYSSQQIDTMYSCPTRIDNMQNFQTENNIIYITSKCQLFEYGNKKFTQHKDVAKYIIWRDNNTKTDSNIGNIMTVHSFENGKGIGYDSGSGNIIKYRNGLWYEHLKTSQRSSHCMWAIDENNFVMAGNGLTQFVEGVESHPQVNVGGWSFKGDWLAVWGVDMEKYWVLDIAGNIAQFEDGVFRGVIRGPDEKSFIDAWVSPEGVVYAITEKEVYRLD